MRPSRARQLGWLLAALIAGAHVHHAAAAANAADAAGAATPRWSFPWFSSLRGGYIDLVTRQPIKAASVAQQEAGPAQGSTQPARTSALSFAPRPAQRASFSSNSPTLEAWEKCFKENDGLSALVSKCNYQETATSCQQLVSAGLLPSSTQSYETAQLTGNFNLPAGCSTGTLAVTYDRDSHVTFNSPQVPVLAVITKDASGAMVNYFGSGSTQGRMRHRLANRVEFCYASGGGAVNVATTAIYSTGMQPGSTSWAFAKSVSLPPAYPGGRVVMFNGDTTDATWTLTASKSGTDVNYQGVVSGTININNPTASVMQVNSITGGVNGGPVATIACPVGTPFTIPACSYVACQYTAYFPKAPAAGTYSGKTEVSYQVQGAQGYPSTAAGTSVFNVGSAASLSSLSTSVGTIAAGTALVTDPGSPQGRFTFSGPGTQTYQTKVACAGGNTGSGAISSTATLTAANGQQITQTATLQKQCYDMRVEVVSTSSAHVGRWGWSVSKRASPTSLNLRPESKAYAASTNPLSFGRDYTATTSADVVYSVTYTRTPPAGVIAGAPAFEASGEVYVHNPAPINARLQGVFVSISNARGGQPYVAQATCPVLIVPAGQRITCAWRATPNFNPVGEQVRATARYINTHNGEPRAATTDVSSSLATIGGGDDGAQPHGRKLQQTWGSPAANAAPQMLGAVASTVYSVDGRPVVVPSSVASGNGVIVSGASLLNGPGNPNGEAAAAAASATPVILPSTLAGTVANRGAFVVNEAGPAAIAAAANQQLSGLQDECVDIADTFLTGNGTVQGKLVAGSAPSGRICATTTFTYTVRYGPYPDCGPRKSVNAATFQTVDTATRGASQADISIQVDGCASPAALRVTPLRAVTSARGGYSWSVSTRADREQLVLGQDGTGVVGYTIDVRRSGAASGATITADATVDNPTPYPITLEAATYTVTMMCDGRAKTASGTVNCDGTTVPAKGSLACRVAGAVPCASNGVYTLVLTAGGQTVTSAPTAFAFNTQQLSAQSQGSQCVDVADLFKSGTGLVEGTVVSGKRPNGKVCLDTTFSYAVKYGPFDKCGPYKASKKVTLLADSPVPAASASNTLPISVVGCNLYTSLERAADCVRPTSWWSGCDVEDDTKCAGGWKLLPGGLGKATPLLTEAGRSYADALAVLAGGSGSTPATKAYAAAAREFAAAQLNFLSGARLPTVDLQEAYDALAALLARGDSGEGASTAQVKAVEGAAALLAKYNAGTLPTSYRAPKRC